MQLPAFSALIISGLPASGKTWNVQQLLEHKGTIYTEPVTRVIFCYRVWQPVYDTIKANDPSVIFVTTTAEVDEHLESDEGHSLVIYDDMMSDVIFNSNEYFINMFTVRLRHQKISAVLVTHLLFHKGLRELNRNCYQFLLTNIPNQSTVSNFFQQFDKLNWREMVQIYLSCMKTDEFPTFFYSRHPQTPPDIRLRNRLVPSKGVVAFRTP